MEDISQIYHSDDWKGRDREQEKKVAGKLS